MSTLGRLKALKRIQDMIARDEPFRRATLGMGIHYSVFYANPDPDSVREGGMKGFWSRDEAVRAAKELKEQGYIVHIEKS